LRCIIRAPTNKRNLIPLPLPTLQLILDIKHRISSANAFLSATVLALGVDELLAEGGVVAVRGRLFDHNLLPVVADLVDDVADRLAELQLVEFRDAFGGYGDAG
jgi:hypothetical protein